jgi:hypothetical protein
LMVMVEEKRRAKICDGYLSTKVGRAGDAISRDCSAKEASHLHTFRAPFGVSNDVQVVLNLSLTLTLEAFIDNDLSVFSSLSTNGFGH